MTPALADVLRRIRHRAGFTQEEISAAVGIARPSVSRIESAQRDTTVEVLEKWVHACGHRLLVVGQDDEALAALTGRMERGDVDLIIRLARLVPRLGTADRRTLLLLLQGWGESYPYESGDINGNESRIIND